MKAAAKAAVKEGDVMAAACVILKTVVENHFTAKQQRAQRDYSKVKIHPFGEDTNHTHFNQTLVFSLASLHLCGGSFIPTAFLRVMRSLAVAMSGQRNYKNGDAQELVGQIERRRASPPSSW